MITKKLMYYIGFKKITESELYMKSQSSLIVSPQVEGGQNSLSVRNTV